MMFSLCRTDRKFDLVVFWADTWKEVRFVIDPKTRDFEDYKRDADAACEVEEADGDWLVEALASCNLDLPRTIANAHFQSVFFCATQDYRFVVDLVTVRCTHSGRPVGIRIEEVK